MKKTAIFIILLTILTKVIGLVRDIVLSYFYGASSISDAYLITFTISSVIFGFIGKAVSTTYIPVSKELEIGYGNRRKLEYTNSLLWFIIFITTIIVLLGNVFTKYLVMLFAAGFSGEVLELTINLTRISLWGLYFTGIVHLFTGFLHSNNKFLLTSYLTLPLNLIIIVFIYLSTIFDLTYLAYGTVLGLFVQFTILFVGSIKNGFRIIPILEVKNPYFLKTIRVAIPVIFSTSLSQINLLIDRSLASRIAIGGVSALNYANKLNGFVQAIFVLTITSLIFPKLSTHYVNKEYYEHKVLIEKTFMIISLVIFPITSLTMIYSKEIVALLFYRGAFDIDALIKTSGALFYYSIGMIGFAFREVLTRGLYSFQETRIAMINSMISIVINIILNLILSRYMGINGLALATSISATLAFLLLFKAYQKTEFKLDTKIIIINLLKISIATCIMVFIVIILNYYLPFNNSFANFFIGSFVGLSVYTPLVYFAKIEYIRGIFNLNLVSVLKKIKK